MKKQLFNAFLIIALFLFMGQVAFSEEDTTTETETLFTSL